MVIKDLIKGDGAQIEIQELNKVIFLKDDQITLFKQKDTLKDQKIGNLELIITKKDQQFDLERAKSESLFKELKSQKRKTFLYKVGSFVGIVATTMLLLK
jgi:flagellar basal body rod protein FlgF